MLPECGFNLSNFHPKASNLYLIIHATHKLNLTGVLLSNYVARAIESGARLGGKRIRYEVLRRLVRSALVSACHILAAYAQFADTTRRHWSKIII
jgi:hypothetical protein